MACKAKCFTGREFIYKSKMISITLLPNGNTWAIDHDQDKAQVQFLPWVTVFGEYLRLNHINPLGFIIRLPNGMAYKLVENDNKFEWRVSKED